MAQSGDRLKPRGILKLSPSPSVASSASGSPTTAPDVSTPTSGDEAVTHPLMDIHIFKGPFIHSIGRNKLEIMTHIVIGVKSGKIAFLAKEELLPEILKGHGITEELSKYYVTEPPPRGFMIPGFVDAHTHAFQFVTAGIGIADGALRRDAKAKMVVREDLAKNVYIRTLRRSMWNGTTTAAYTTSNNECESRQFSRILAQNSQRAYIGMEVHLFDKSEDLYMVHLHKLQDFIKYMQRLKCSHVHPYLVSTFSLPPWVWQKVADIRSSHNLMLKMGCHQATQESTGLSLSASSELGMLSNQAVVTHGNFLEEDDVKILKESQVKLVHCPSTEIKYPPSICPVKALLMEDIPIGLGTDSGNSDTISMLHAIRHAVQASHIKHHDMMRDDTPTSIKCPDARLSPIEAFYMATMGSATVLGIEHEVGTFEVGKYFDALIVQTDIKDGPFDIYYRLDNKIDIFEKFLALGDDRNIGQVYIAGKRVK